MNKEELQRKVKELEADKSRLEKENEALKNFIEMLESYTDSWESLCDCPYSDGGEVDTHYLNCITVKLIAMRKSE